MILLRCYAKITDWVYEIFNHASFADFRYLPIYSYGFWVAVGFFAAATLAAADMKRREKLGLLTGQVKEITIGAPVNWGELVMYFLFGFIVLFKLIGIFTYHSMLAGDVPAIPFGTYMVADTVGGIGAKIASFFTYGSWAGGILGGGVLAGYYYYTTKKAQLEVPKVEKVTVYPSDNIGDLVVIAAVLGVLGSVLFNFLESDDSINRFMQDPVGFLTSGLSIYGGLICAGIGFGVYAYVKKINILQFFDSVAPGYMLANGIGRIGCQTAGDGDWGLANLAPKPGWMPQWLWADYYPHNIINEGVPIQGCIEEHCTRLQYPAYPTPIYEFLMCTAVFIILWSLRKKLTYKPGMIFTLFLVMVGIQRYAIEQWRDLSGRELYHIAGGAFKQSELISIVLFILGVIGTVYLYRRYTQPKQV
jgi:prolipoprotein diacylglyceryltransferase